MARLRSAPSKLKPMDMRTCRPPPKVADKELKTADHEAWRKAVLDRAGWACQDCGKQGGRGSNTRLYADHIVERRDGGSLTDVNNGRCRCASCHTLKTNAERGKRMHDKHEVGE